MVLNKWEGDVRCIDLHQQKTRCPTDALQMHGTHRKSHWRETFRSGFVSISATSRLNQYVELPGNTILHPRPLLKGFWKAQAKTRTKAVKPRGHMLEQNPTP